MNKVLLTGLIVAIVNPVIVLLNGDHISLYNIVFSVGIAAGSYLSRNMKGQVWTMVGIVAASATNFFTSNPEPTGMTLKYVLASYVLPMVIQIVTAFSGPEKPQE